MTTTTAGTVVALTAFHHVALTVADVDASADWYARVLGFVEVFREQREGRKATVMRFPAGGHSVALVEHTDTEPSRFDPTRVGLDHLAFNVGSRDELDRWAERFAAAGVNHTGPTAIPTGALVNLTDPDGTALALFWDQR